MRYVVLLLLLVNSVGLFSEEENPPLTTAPAVSVTPPSCLLNTVIMENADAVNCCFALDLQATPGQDVTTVETVLLTPDVLFSSIQYELASPWSYTAVWPQRRLRWTYEGGIPTTPTDWFSFCLSGWTANEAVALEVRWQSASEIIQRDTLLLNCVSCAQLNAGAVGCLPDSSYQYTFDFTNNSGFLIHTLDIREPGGQDLIEETSIDLIPPLANEMSLSGQMLHFRPEAEGLDELCFEITPRQLVSDTIAIQCCTRTFCVPIPECDRCCTDYPTFAADVNAGFSFMTDCEALEVRVQANQLNECDRVVYEITGLGSGLVDGNEPITFSGLEDGTQYELCMTVTRQDLDGVNCYEETSLTVCETLFLDCFDCFAPGQINYRIECPAIIDLVCGCDGMTYLNACAAINWAGITTWEDGPCGEPPVDEITLVALLINGPQAQLNWLTGGQATYRYFIVQRRVPGGPWFTIGFTNSITFDFLDTDPILPFSDYRVVGVTLPGKVVFSNVDQVGITANEEVGANERGRLYPNPTTGQFWLELPWAATSNVRIFNIQGQLITSFQVNGSSPSPGSAAEWPAGIYVLVAEHPDGTMLYNRLIKL